jgi:hypothetical protein
MALVAELVTELKVKDIGFHSAMKGAAAAVGIFVAATAAIYKVVDSTTERIDNMAKSAERLGVSLEAFQGLGFAAKIGNSDIETLTAGMTKLARSVDTSVHSANNSGDAFARLGLKASDLQKLSLDKQYIAVADAMSNVANAGEKIALSQALFGKGGAKQLTIMRENLRGLSDEYKSLNLSITEQQAAQADAFQDSKTRLESIFSGFMGQVGSQLAPAFTTIIDGITGSVSKMADLREASKSVASAVIGSFKFMSDGLGVFLTAFDVVINKFNAFSDHFKNTSAGVGQFLAGVTGNAASYKMPAKSTSSQSEMGMFGANLSALAEKAQNAIFEPMKSSALTASQSLDKFSDVAVKASSQISTMLSSIENSAVSSELDRILKSSMSSGKEAFRSDAFDRAIKEIYNQAKNGQAGENQGNIESLFGRASREAASTGGDRFDNSAALGVIKELQSFVKEQTLGVKKPMELNVNISTSEGFNMKIANSPEIKATITDGLKTLIATTASSVGK